MAQFKHTLFFALVVAVIAIIILAVMSQPGTAQLQDTPLTDEGRPQPEPQESLGLMDLETAKQVMLDRVKQGVPLSITEKDNFLSVLRGTQFGLYKFTEEETEMIINALNQ